MLDIKSTSRVKVHWKTTPYDYSKDKVKTITEKMSAKYGIPKERIKVVPDFVTVSDDGSEKSFSTDIIQNIQDPQFQVKLFMDYLSMNNIEDYDFELIKKIDSEINAGIDYQVYDKYRRYGIKWIKWDNFLSYGDGNYFDFTNIKGMTSLSGQNQSGKTTLSIDLVHFLLFGRTAKVSTQDKIFNKHLPEATTVTVEGCITIDGEEYIIKRTLTRPSLHKRTQKSKTTQKVEYYKVAGDTLMELEDCDENYSGENSAQTNKVIKEAVGKESDFDLIMSITESTLDDLVNKKEAERGRLLSRWIGLLPIEEKDKIAREKYNGDVKPRLLSNQYNGEVLSQEIKALTEKVSETEKNTKALEKENKGIDKELSALEKKKEKLISEKGTIDPSVMSIDITTLNTKIERNVEEGKRKSEEIKAVEDELKKIGDVEFSVSEFDKLVAEITERTSEIGVVGEQYRQLTQQADKLRKSQFCPTCGKKLDNVDNSKKIASLEQEASEVEGKGKALRETINKLREKSEALKKDRDKYYAKSELTIKKSALEVNVERLRNEYRENVALKKEYEKNSAIISKNNEIDIQVRNTDVLIREKRENKERNVAYIADNERVVKSSKEQIEIRESLSKKLKDEETLVRNWKIYLEMVGKDGISKMVLRKALPIINTRLSDMLSDVCDFDVEVGINDKNDVMFYLIKDGVRSDLSSGSGFELTASALALRYVLSEMSTIPKMDGVTYDEVFGRVSKDNYENIRNLMEKISKSFEWCFLISHNNEVHDWCDNHVSVVKENNISRIILG